MGALKFLTGHMVYKPDLYLNLTDERDPGNMEVLLSQAHSILCALNYLF